MSELWPKEAAEFKSFLTNVGLDLQFEQESAAFGDRLIQYANERISVRMISDRGVWFIEVSDPSYETGDWYDVALFRDLLCGPGGEVLTLSEQAHFVRENWQSVLSSFESDNRNLTHARLGALRRERAERRIPGLRI